MKLKHQLLFRLGINGSPTVIEVAPGLSVHEDSKTLPAPGAVLEFGEDGCDLFAIALDYDDLNALVDLLVDTIEYQHAAVAAYERRKAKEVIK